MKSINEGLIERRSLRQCAASPRPQWAWSYLLAALHNNSNMTWVNVTYRENRTWFPASSNSYLHAERLAIFKTWQVWAMRFRPRFSVAPIDDSFSHLSFSPRPSFPAALSLPTSQSSPPDAPLLGVVCVRSVGVAAVPREHRPWTPRVVSAPSGRTVGTAGGSAKSMFTLTCTGIDYTVLKRAYASASLRGGLRSGASLLVLCCVWNHFLF